MKRFLTVEILEKQIQVTEGQGDLGHFKQFFFLNKKTLEQKIIIQELLEFKVKGLKCPESPYLTVYNSV
jgi:hypothetical protein